MNIDHPQDPDCTTESIQKDIDAAKQKGYKEYEFAFTYVTVQALLNKIEELDEELLGYKLQDVRQTF